MIIHDRAFAIFPPVKKKREKNGLGSTQRLIKTHYLQDDRLADSDHLLFTQGQALQKSLKA